MDLGDGGFSPEDDPTTFGQLIPLFLIFLTFFAFLQIMSGTFTLSQSIALSVAKAY